MNTKLNYVEDWLTLARQANWSVAEVAKSCNVTVRTLQLHFLKTIGKSPKAWMVEQRQKQAFELLRNGASVKQAAAELGFERAQYFSREFKKHWGFCPTETKMVNSDKVRILV